jgi:A/G-specific adenine glycosylase
VSKASPIDEQFAERLLSWFDQHGRHDLPWQHPRSGYFVWLSEIMLQQTQVATVVPYFLRFTHRFPDLAALASASLDEVLALWAGLGYYSRARNLHACARKVVLEHQGEFPSALDALIALPGIGRSTAGAIAAQAFGKRAAILDGNVKRVLARQIALDDWPGALSAQALLWDAASARLPRTRLPDYSQALMDLGALLCTRKKPQCALCPVQQSCKALALQQVDVIPKAKPKRAVVHREIQWLIASNSAGEILLERRAEQGIWGGLYSLPEFNEAEMLTRLQALSLTPLAPAQQQATIKHVFTHFTLHATPWLVQVSAASSVREAHMRWQHPSACAELGLPAPIKALLQVLAKRSEFALSVVS